MKIEIVNTELPRVEADEICEKVNTELEGKKWCIEIENGTPRFYSDSDTDETYWDICWDKYNMGWYLNYGFKYVGDVRIEDDINILYNR